MDRIIEIEIQINNLEKQFNEHNKKDEFFYKSQLADQIRYKIACLDIVLIRLKAKL